MHEARGADRWADDRRRRCRCRRCRRAFRRNIPHTINKVFARTIMTASTTFLAALALFLFGGGILRESVTVVPEILAIVVLAGMPVPVMAIPGTKPATSAADMVRVREPDAAVAAAFVNE